VEKGRRKKKTKKKKKRKTRKGEKRRLLVEIERAIEIGGKEPSFDSFLISFVVHQKGTNPPWFPCFLFLLSIARAFVRSFF
jgi:hypothetical protein